MCSGTRDAASPPRVCPALVPRPYARPLSAGDLVGEGRKGQAAAPAWNCRNTAQWFGQQPLGSPAGSKVRFDLDVSIV